MRETKRYLAVFFIPKQEQEHASIAAAIKHHSDGDYQLVHMQVGQRPDVPFTVAYLFTSGTPPWEMGFGLLNGDKHVIVEVGDRSFVSGSNLAEKWLREHETPRS